MSLVLSASVTPSIDRQFVPQEKMLFQPVNGCVRTTGWWFSKSRPTLLGAPRGPESMASGFFAA